MNDKKTKALILTLLLLDIIYSFVQHYHVPLDGDMAAIILPASWYAQVLEDPFGLSVILQGAEYGGSNRFFCHWFLSFYYKNIPLVLQYFVDPVESVYLAGAFLKTGIQLLMLVALAGFITWRRFFSTDFLLAALLVAPVFQTQGYNLLMGLIERSPTYAVFYSLPMALLLLFFLPFYRHIASDGKYRLSARVKTLLAAGVVILPFSGPLIPAVVILVCSLGGCYLFLKFKKAGFPGWLTTSAIYFAMISLLSLYSIYIGTGNSEQQVAELPVWERYFRLPVGIFWQFAHKAGFPLLTVAILVNIWFVKRYPVEKMTTIVWLRWLSLFVLLYLLILPLGGFREYRSLIIRRDTMLPITLSMVFFFGLTCFQLIKNLPQKPLRKYIAWVVAVLLIYTIADEPRPVQQICEKQALEKIAKAGKSPVRIEADCTVLSWEKITDPRDSYWNARLLEIWNITDERRLYYH